MSNKRMILGRATEDRVVSMLLFEDREVYLPVVDDHGVDLIVRTRPGGTSTDEFQEIQVKSLEKGGLFAAISCPNPRPNYWFVFYVKAHDTMWLINSMVFVNIASQNVNGKNIGKYSLGLSTVKGISKARAGYIVEDLNKIP